MCYQILLLFDYKYFNYVQEPSNLCVGTNKQEHLNWTWKQDFNYDYYFGLIFINLANFYTNKNLMTSIGVSYLFLLVSKLNFKENIGELWCLSGTSIPLVALFMQKVLNINN